MINATHFLSALEKTLGDYCELLKASDWEDSVWVKCRRKLRHISAGTLVEPEGWGGSGARLTGDHGPDTALSQ